MRKLRQKDCFSHGSTVGNVEIQIQEFFFFNSRFLIIKIHMQKVCIFQGKQDLVLYLS